MTVFGRSTLGPAHRRGDMGIFIKSVVPGGAAALVSGRSLLPHRGTPTNYICTVDQTMDLKFYCIILNDIILSLNDIMSRMVD